MDGGTSTKQAVLPTPNKQATTLSQYSGIVAVNIITFFFRKQKSPFGFESS